MSERDVVLSVVVMIDEKGEHYGRVLIGEGAFITGPWTTVDALLHHVSRVAADHKQQSNTEHHGADARAWVV
jgi:hypothetical protein